MILQIKALIVLIGAMICMFISIMLVIRELAYFEVCPILFKKVSIFIDLARSPLNLMVISIGTIILRNVL